MADDKGLKETMLRAERLAHQNAKAIEAATRASGPILEVTRPVQQNPSMRHLLDDMERTSSLARLALGPLAELQLNGALSASSEIHKQFRQARDLMAGLETRFRLPEVDAISRLVLDIQRSSHADVLKRYAEDSSRLQSAIRAMRAPWLDVQDSLRSVRGFAQLQGIGSLVGQFATFGDRVADTIRVDLGDWRDSISWPAQIFEDLEARSEFYLDRGFDPSLTDFPAPAFREGAEIAGLRREAPPLIQEYGFPCRDPKMQRKSRRFRGRTTHTTGSSGWRRCFANTLTSR